MVLALCTSVFKALVNYLYIIYSSLSYKLARAELAVLTVLSSASNTVLIHGRHSVNTLSEC